MLQRGSALDRSADTGADILNEQPAVDRLGPLSSVDAVTAHQASIDILKGQPAFERLCRRAENTWLAIAWSAAYHRLRSPASRLSL